MRAGSLSKIFAIAILFSLISAWSVMGQVSLLPEHTITVDGVTLIRDSHKAGRWYYVPERPMLLERNPANSADPRPVFNLLAYQAKKDSELYEGGVLQFCVSMNISEDAKKRLEKSLKESQKLTATDEISLAPLPYHKAEAFLFDASGKMNADGVQVPGLAPAFVTGSLPLQVKLDKFDTDLYSALVRSKTGVGVLMNLTFEGVLPPAGFKVAIDWDQTFTHMSQSSETRVAVGNYLCGIDIGISKTKIREELISKGCMKVESVTSEAVSNETLDRYMDPVIARMQQTLIEKIHPPEKIDTTSRNKPDSLSKCFFAAKISTSVELKNVKSSRLGSETFEFNQQVVVNRKTACGAFIGIGSYSDEVKKRLVNTMPLDSWASAFLTLPGVENTPELHLNSVSMTANVVDAKGKAVSGLSDTASWSNDAPQSWKNKDGQETGSLKFPLMALFKMHDDKIDVIRKEYSFKVDVIVEQQLGTRLSTTNISYLTPMFDGSLPLPAAVDLVDNIVFDLSTLTFNYKEGLKKLKIVITRESGSNKLEYLFSEKNKDESSVIFIVAAAREGEEKPEQLLPVVTFETSGKKTIQWEYNGKDLRATDPSLYFMLFDSDWSKTP